MNQYEKNQSIDNHEVSDGIEIFEVSLENIQMLAELRFRINGDKTMDALLIEAKKYATDRDKKAFILMDKGFPISFVEMMVESDDLHKDSPIIKLEGLAHIVRIAVLSEYRQRGIGQKMMLLAEEWAKSKDKIGLWLDYLSLNENAAKLYRKMGYRNVEEFFDTRKGKMRTVAIKYF